MAEFVVGFLVQMEPWGLKKACKKFEEKFTKIDTSLYKHDKIIVYHLFCIPYYFQSLLEKVNNALCFLQVFCLLSPGEQQKEESAI